MLEKIKTLVRENDICVLATAGVEGPHTSLMAYLCSEDVTDIYLVMSRRSRQIPKHRPGSKSQFAGGYPRKDPRSTIRALTIDGQARVVLDEGESNMMLQAFARRHSHLNGLLEQGDISLVRIQIRTLQLLNGPQQAHHILLP